MAAKKKEEFNAKMKRLRKKHKISIQDLARETAYHAEYLGSVESGDRRPPVSAIIRISNALDVDAGTFLSADEGASRKKKAESYKKRDKAYSYKTLTPGAKNKHMKGFQVSIDPESDHEGVAYQHEGEEFVYVLEGRLEMKVGSKKHDIKKGQSIHFNSNLVHKLRNPGKKRTELIVVVYTP